MFSLLASSDRVSFKVPEERLRTHSTSHGHSTVGAENRGVEAARH